MTCFYPLLASYILSVSHSASFNVFRVSYIYIDLDFNNRNAQISILNCGIPCKLLTKNLSSERIIVFVCISLMPQYLVRYAYCECPREMEGIKNGMFSLAGYDVVFVQEILIDQKK